MTVLLSSFLVDFGVEHLLEIKGETNFPWLMTNVKDKDTGRQLAEGKKFLIIEWEETKVGHSRGGRG